MASAPDKPRLAAFAGRTFRLVRRRRRFFAAVLFCAAIAIAVNQLAPGSQAVLSAARDLPSGTRLSAADLRLVRVPTSLLPDAALARLDDATGQQLAGALRKGQLLTDASLVGQSLLAGAPPGSSAVPLRLADPATAQLVSPGQLVTVVGTSDDGTGRTGAGTVLATAVPVLWAQRKSEATSNWAAAKDAEGLVVIAATAEQATALAGAVGRTRLSLVLVSPP
jgi:pilus assembly protein CpaB